MNWIFEQGAFAGQQFTPERPVIVIGRGSQSDIVLPEHLVSRQHARIEHGPQGWMLTDLGSTNGTLLNGQPIRAHEPHVLRPGDRVTIGNSVLAFRQEVPEAAVPREDSRRGGPQPILLIVAALLIVIVLAGIIALLVMLLQPEEELNAPEPMEPLEQIQTVLPVPSAFEDIVTALPVPTQLEDMGTALPVPTQFEDLATSVMTSIPIELPEFPLEGTPVPPLAGAVLPERLVHAGNGGVGP